jgi:hypothetical protein
VYLPSPTPQVFREALRRDSDDRATGVLKRELGIVWRTARNVGSLPANTLPVHHQGRNGPLVYLT